MINLICIVMVHIGPKYDTVFMEGQMIEETSKHYLVDFSKEADKKGYTGDYSGVFVEKLNCGPATKRIII